MNHLSYHVYTATKINERGLDKPNEDCSLVDETLNLFVVLDGITRVHSEYSKEHGKSAACDINTVFLEAAHAYIKKNACTMSPEVLLRNASIEANKALVEYRKKQTLEQWKFYPGTLGILALLSGNRLYYAYTGDCLGTLIRNNTKLHFGQQGANGALEAMKIGKADRYDRYCNHPEADLGYGIFNGDSSMDALLEQSWLDIYSGDTVLLSTDGLEDYIRYTKAETLAKQSPDEILLASGCYDKPPFAEYADDKTILKLQF